MHSQPQIDQRTEQPYMGIRLITPWQQLPTVIPQSIGEVFGFLGQHGVEPRGAPFIRYHVIDMERELDVEIGVPVDAVVSANGRVAPGSFPAGRYVSLIHTGPYDQLVQANAALLDWAAQNNLTLDHHPTERGDAFASRYESYLSEPEEKPERTEVAIRLAD
ncbi:MAG TPA: GyrI-like domain-containing protein [Chloroflexota bacterium]|jgi:effector-binding domain-containing protein|nr:GyrI-like domain-containing protein [Chloroflexota bacterium]